MTQVTGARRIFVRPARPSGLKMKNPDAPAVKREAEEEWGGQAGGEPHCDRRGFL
jgi:hypothetical protein